MHGSRLWEGSEVAEINPHTHRENMHTPHRKAHKPELVTAACIETEELFYNTARVSSLTYSLKDVWKLPRSV